MAPKRPTAHDRLSQLDRALAERQSLARTAAGAIAEASHALEQLKEQRIAAYAEADERKAADLKSKQSGLEAGLLELSERGEGAELASERARGERDAYLAENTTALLAELKPAAAAASAAIETSAAELQRARAEWHQLEAQVATLLRAAGVTTGSIPRIEPLDAAIKALGLVASDVPLPMPGTMVQAVTPRATATVEGTGR